MAVLSSRLKKTSRPTSVFAPDVLPEFDNHESVTFINDPVTGLRGFIAIHNTNRGPAVGGTRFWNYENDEDALKDALRLSRAMSYKCALADVPYGGGKAVLIMPKKPGAKNEKYLAEYAKRLELLSCGFYTGEDVGLDERDIAILEKHSKCIIGRPDVGDLPSYWAALSVFYAMQAALQDTFESDSFAGRKIAIKGLGNVGYELAKLVASAGATVIAADLDKKRIAKIRSEIPSIQIASPEDIHRTKADIYAPCAMGGDLTVSAISQLQTPIVCGAANNQLASEEIAGLLHAKKILYIPDYVANAGGLINVVDELARGGYNRARVEKRVKNVRNTVVRLVTEAKRRNVSTEAIASRIARSKIRL